MSSTSAGSWVPPIQLVQAIPAATAAATPPQNSRLSVEDITKYFHLPIADAASILGVCTSVLKRICRENGIIRWPYRKFLAGKTVDDIKKEAAREKTKELAGNTAKQNVDAPKVMPSISAGLSTFGSQVPNRAPGHQGVSIPGNMLQTQVNKSSVQSQTRLVPTYLDDFKHGFPSNGLASVSLKWWGDKSIESGDTSDSENSATDEDEKQGSNITEPSASLVALRKRALECGSESLKVGISNCEFFKLGKRRRTLLSQVFRSSLPNQWKDNYS